jgi:hypothetical protein
MSLVMDLMPDSEDFNMTYHFMHYFDHPLGWQNGNYLTDEQKIEIAKENAAKDLAKKLLETAQFKINEQGNVEGTLYIP